MCNFTDKDVEAVKKWGNEKAQKYWMRSYNKTLYPIPDRRDVIKMKEFMKVKYVQKRFLEQEDAESSSDKDDSSDSDSKKDKKNKHKKSKKKAKKSKKKKSSSSESESDEKSGSDEEKDEDEPPQKVEKGGKLKQPKISNNTLPKTQTQVKKAEPKKQDNSGLLELDFETPASTASITTKQTDNGLGDLGWADFGGSSGDNNGAQDNSWGSFDNPASSQKKTDDLLNSLGDLYKTSSQNQFQQNYYGQYNPYAPQQPTQSNPYAAFGTTSFGAGTQMAAPTQTHAAHASSGFGDDPFSIAIQEQNKQKQIELQKAQAAKLAAQHTATAATGAPGASTGITPNMFMQQMMAMMQTQPQNNQNTAMMFAAMQNMMSQMSMNSGTVAPKVHEPEPIIEPAPKTNTAFTSLFNSAASSSIKGSTPKPHTTTQSSTSSWNAFGSSASAAPSAPLQSDPFGGFPTTQSSSTTNSNSIFDTPFSNSGFGGSSSFPSSSSGGSSSNPFDMFK